MISSVNLHEALLHSQSLLEIPPKETELIKKNVNEFDFDLLDTKRIFHRDAIKKTCVNYRLRFLDFTLFKGDVPITAKQKIKTIEKEHDTKLQNLKIVAPSSLFKLKNTDDPLLFVPMGNNYYYLIHKWGNDLHPLRRLLVWPFKNIITSVISLVALSFILTFFLPLNLFSAQPTWSDFLLIFLFMFKSIAAIVIYYAFATGKNFNRAIWDSTYYNS